MTVNDFRLTTVCNPEVIIKSANMPFPILLTGRPLQTIHHTWNNLNVHFLQITSDGKIILYVGA